MSFIQNLEISKDMKLNLIVMNNSKRNLNIGTMDKKHPNKSICRIKLSSTSNYLILLKINQTKFRSDFKFILIIFLFFLFKNNKIKDRSSYE